MWTGGDSATEADRGCEREAARLSQLQLHHSHRGGFIIENIHLQPALHPCGCLQRKYYAAGEPNQRRSSHDPHLRGADHPGAGGDAGQVLPLSGCSVAAQQGNSCGSRLLICYRLQ